MTMCVCVCVCLILVQELYGVRVDVVCWPVAHSMANALHLVCRQCTHTIQFNKPSKCIHTQTLYIFIHRNTIDIPASNVSTLRSLICIWFDGVCFCFLFCFAVDNSVNSTVVCCYFFYFPYYSSLRLGDTRLEKSNREQVNK